MIDGGLCRLIAFRQMTPFKAPRIFFPPLLPALLAAIAPAAPAAALTLDWTGFARAEAYAGRSPEDRSYGLYHLALKPEIQLIDGLRVFGRLDLHSSQSRALFPPASEFRSAGAVFFRSPGGKAGDYAPLLLELSQFYISYETEFFRLQLGRAPLDFGLGAVYSAERSSFERWLSLGDQISLRLEREPFYLEPAFVRQRGAETGRAFGLLQGGIAGGSWRLEGFYRHGLKDFPSAAEIFGEYKKPDWDVQSSLAWVFQDSAGKAPAIGAAVEGGAKIPAALSPRAELKAGFATKGFSFHPNYDAALLFWNHYFDGEGKEGEVFAEEGRISGGAFVSPRLVFSALEGGKLKIIPAFAARHDFQSKSFDYEIDLQASCSLEGGFAVGLEGGWLLKEKKSFFGLLAKAAVTF